jgi:hypothetical protein
MKPWLRLIERIQDLPIQQLDQHLARTLADELGVPYQPVSRVFQVGDLFEACQAAPAACV